MKAENRRLSAYAEGTSQKNLLLRDFRSFEVGSLPPLSEQNQITSFLGTLDDKIELNRKTNETLEGIAKALFKSWFVDFDPVRAKAEGRATGLTNDMTDLFPDSFEESELGEIPSGWKVDSFTTQFNILGGGTPKTSIDEFWGGDLPGFQSSMLLLIPTAGLSKPRNQSLIVVSKTVRQTFLGRELRSFLPVERSGRFAWLERLWQ